MDEGEGGAAIRERILPGVDRLFYAQGIKSAGVDAIAAELGISKKTLYRHFPSKDNLVIGYLRGRFRPMPEASTKPPAEQILAGLAWIARSDLIGTSRRHPILTRTRAGGINELLGRLVQSTPTPSGRLVHVKHALIGHRC
jgi:AcrR family transcriptional regulator